MNNPKQNPNCDHNRCTSPNGEVRLFPIGGGGNMILCRACYRIEFVYLIERIANESIEPFEIPMWSELKKYTIDEG